MLILNKISILSNFYYHNRNEIYLRKMIEDDLVASLKIIKKLI